MPTNPHLPDTHPHSTIHVPKSYDHAVLGNFLKKKHFALTQLAGQREADYWLFSTDNFAGLFDALGQDIEGFRVYLAAYTETGNPKVDAFLGKGYRDNLVLVFTGTDADFQDIQRKDPKQPYYVITPPWTGPGGQFKDGELVALTQEQASGMVARYRNHTVPFLKALYKASQEHYGKRPDPLFAETNSIIYPMPDFWEVVSDDIRKTGAKAISAFLGSYSNDIERDYNHPVEQLTLTFNYASTFDFEGKTYYFHYDLEDFSVPEVTNGSNTGNPCPPNPCAGSSIP